MTFDDNSKFHTKIIGFLLIFFILYDLNFSFLPFLTSGRIAFLFLLITTFKKVNFDNIYYWGCMIFGILLFYSIFQSLFSTDLTQCSRLFWFLIYGWILPYFVSFYIIKAEQVYLFIFLAAILQALLVFGMFFNLEFRFLILDILELKTNINPYENFQRAFGFTSLTGSTFSLVQACGLIFGLFYFTRNTFNSILINMVIWIGLIVILLSTFLIGRTGLLISLCFLLFYFVLISKVKHKILFIIVSFCFYQIDFQSDFVNLTENVEGFKSQWFINWIEEAFNFRKNSTLEELNTMYVAPITIETIIGTGRVKSENGIGNASLNDSGYIQTYFSLGLIMSVIFYLTYFSLSLFRWLNSNREPLLFVFLIMVFLVENKEPFLFKYSLPFLLSTFLIYEYKLQKS